LGVEAQGGLRAVCSGDSLEATDLLHHHGADRQPDWTGPPGDAEATQVGATPEGDPAPS